MATTFRDRYPPPWTVKPIPAPGYGIYDANGFLFLPLYAEADDGGVNAHRRISMAEAKALAEQIAVQLGQQASSSSSDPLLTTTPPPSSAA
jgi:hypothetical protein